ncbi:MAG: YjjI family glycine radical enzyme [Acidimicrobiia bacterium]|nr:MAG: YjjI family glycine radical enzyme [Acidimicrobiia bacterium]
MLMDEFIDKARAIVNDSRLTFHQRRHYLAALAENALPYPTVSPECAEALNKDIISDLFEGHAPYRPRYVLPDYELALLQGSKHLELDPPRDLDEAITFLLILYTQVPSITGYPVYLGDIDSLLLPYVDDVSDSELRSKLRMFWIALDRILPDGFAHANIGPEDNRILRTILDIERELLQIVPNLSLKVDPDRTTDGVVSDAVETVFATGKPHFVNHPMMVGDLGAGYGVVSCYNSLKKGGGSHTLVRLNLKEVALTHTGPIDEFLVETLPHFASLNAELMSARIRYLVEEAKFFEHDFLAREGLVRLDRFSAMFGVYGLAEAVNILMEHAGLEGRYGDGNEADQLSYRIIEHLRAFVDGQPMPYCEGAHGRAFLHSQSGIDSDLDVTAGTRIPIGTEPETFKHISTVTPHHRHFDAGISDIFHIDDTVRNNPGAMVDIIRGAFTTGMRDFTFNVDSNDFVRITGYLVRKSELAKFAEEGERHSSTVFAAGSVANSHVTDRATKRVLIHEHSPRPAQ